MADLTVFVCTYNSAATLERCLRSVVESEPGAKLVVVDQCSSDSTAEIARSFGAELHFQKVGLGFARQMCFRMAETPYMAFVDGDEEIMQNQFFRRAIEALRTPQVGAVVGLGLGHRFGYGLPMGLLVLRTEDFRGDVIPSFVNAREEYYVSARLRSRGMSTVFLADAMVHRSRFRRYKPEWEGANTRLVGGISPRQLLFILRVIILQSLNSGSTKNMLYVPVFYLKFLRGFSDPAEWQRIRQVD